MGFVYYSISYDLSVRFLLILCEVSFDMHLCGHSTERGSLLPGNAHMAWGSPAPKCAVYKIYWALYYQFDRLLCTNTRHLYGIYAGADLWRCRWGAACCSFAVHKFSKVLRLVALYSKYTRALTLRICVRGACIWWCTFSNVLYIGSWKVFYDRSNCNMIEAWKVF